MPIKNSTEEEKRKLFSKAFTLVEMLIVIVLIWILSVAILPRLTNYMAKTRDLKRQADLKNIAAAIEMYGINHGEFPFYHGGHTTGAALAYNFFRKASDLAEPLEGYISSIPSDPKKSTQIDICAGSHRIECKVPLKKGNYLYAIQREKKDLYPLDKGRNIALLVAKVETLDYANFVLVNQNQWRCNGCWWSFWNGNASTFGIYPARIWEKFNLCSSIEKARNAEWIKQEDGNFKCTYTTEDQLYYIIKME